MLAVIDPCFLQPDNPIGEPVLKELVWMIHQFKMRIPSVSWYWPAIVHEFLTPLSRMKKAERTYVGHLDKLRTLVQDVSLPEPPKSVRVWDFDGMFQEPWIDVMQRLLAGCVLTREPTILITRLIEGRNVRVHPHGNVIFEEKTCWRLRVQPAGDAMVGIPCVHSPRNHQVSWTCRYDLRLPAVQDRAKFPFCPAKDWENHSVAVFRVYKSRRVWVDSHGNYWARPSTGGGHHWDVYLERPGLAEEYGLHQLNIVQWGAPASEGDVGDIHHDPKEKRSKLKKRTGWSC